MQDLQNRNGRRRCVVVSATCNNAPVIPPKRSERLQMQVESEPRDPDQQEGYRAVHYFEYTHPSGTRQKWRPQWIYQNPPSG